MRYKAGLETRERILDATRSLVAENGLDGTTIKAICEQAGVLPGSFYNLFASKEQAIVTVVREAIDAVDPDPAHQGTDTLASWSTPTSGFSRSHRPFPGSTSESGSPAPGRTLS